MRKGNQFTTSWRTIQIASEAVGLINSSLILNLNEPCVLETTDWIRPLKYVGVWWLSLIHISFRTATTAHLKHGATTMFPTLSSTSFERLYQAVDVCESMMQEKDSPILGLHIEGPYLNPKMAGTQYDGFLKTPDENEYIPLLEHTSCIKRWDISPELLGAHDLSLIHI